MLSTLSEFKQSVNELSELMAEENAAVLGGEFALLNDIAPRKMSLVADLEAFIRSHGASLDEEARRNMASLQRSSEHNGRVLKAAYNGSLAAQNRIGEVASRQADIGAYGMNGKAIISSEAVISRSKTV